MTAAPVIRVMYGSDPDAFDEDQTPVLTYGVIRHVRTRMDLTKSLVQYGPGWHLVYLRPGSDYAYQEYIGGDLLDVDSAVQSARKFLMGISRQVGS